VNALRQLLILIACFAAIAGDAAAHRSNASNVKLQIYSNWPSSRTYLGCLNCAATDPNSIWNRTSRYGWTNPDGIWSQPALRHANYRRLVCDMPLTAPPPAVLDDYNGFYYVLTIDAVRRNSICSLEMSRQGCAAVQALCGGKTAADVSAAGWTDIVVGNGRPR
jgi:hypothetical protein